MKADPSNKKKLQPVLIIPGFMSSVLTVQSSSLQPSWKDQRIWLNITTLGFNHLKRGGKLQRNEDIRSRRQMLNDSNNDRDASIDSTLEHMHSEYLRQVECKNKWVQHMKLRDDSIGERKGVVVRALEGTAGALTESMSYVFGPVLKLLRSYGYEDGVNLDAAPYDWRIPPSTLESRDQYFTRTIKKIEVMYRDNDQTPVVILSHSMGCRASHYLFNFVLHTKGKDEGMKWLSKHIDCWVPVGAPHIGTPTSDFEGLVLARSFGSPPWLFPLEEEQTNTESSPPQSNEITIAQPKFQKATMPTSFLMQESALGIKIPSQRLNVQPFLKHVKHPYPVKLRIAIRLGKKLVFKSNHFTVSEDEPFIDFNDEAWLVPCPVDLVKAAHDYSTIQISIEKPGAVLRRKDSERYGCGILCPIRCIICLLKWLLCCPCAFLEKFCHCFSTGVQKGMNAGASVLGSSVVMGQSEPIQFGEALADIQTCNSDEEEGTRQTFNIQAVLRPFEVNDSLCQGIWSLLFYKYQQEQIKLSINVKWEPAFRSSSTEAVPLWERSRKYMPCDTNQLFNMEGMGNVPRLLDNSYLPDPIGPLSQSSWQPPPVKRVVSIYGINYPTEVSAVYRRNLKHIPNASNNKSSMKKSISSELEPTFVLDKDAILAKPISKTHAIKKGLIYETSNSPQKVTNADGTTTTEFKSGDGSVPYWSLQHCRTWIDRGPAKCDVTVHEIDSVEHRAILNDARFHKILLDLLGCG
eukprot:scaffold90081_cov79-Cyclotella_meneghiniana.AAC.1